MLPSVSYQKMMSPMKSLHFGIDTSNNKSERNLSKSVMLTKVKQPLPQPLEPVRGIGLTPRGFKRQLDMSSQYSGRSLGTRNVIDRKRFKTQNFNNRPMTTLDGALISP